MPKRMFMPWGSIATSVVLYGYPSAGVVHDKVGAVAEDWHLDDMPNLNLYKMPNGAILLVDDNGAECLDSYCRVVEVGDDFDEWEGDVGIDAWDDEVCVAARRATALHDALKRLDQMRGGLPGGFEDTTIKPVLDAVVVARIKDEIERLELTITRYAASRVEIEHYDERVKPPCRTCLEATETRLLPCDECGTLDEPGEDDEDELLRIADDKHAAQMADLDHDETVG